jgi:hypothetical protein
MRATLSLGDIQSNVGATKPVLTAIERHIRDLTSERPAAAELARIRGLRVYAEITADNKHLDAEAPR